MEKGSKDLAGGRDYRLVSKCIENSLKEEWKYRLRKTLINQV